MIYSIPPPPMLLPEKQGGVLRTMSEKLGGL